MEEREGDRELNLSPFLEDDALNMALEGFERRRPLATHASDDSYAGLVEYLQNGKQIDWRYWVENMPTLSPAEAARLMRGLDPELYEDLNSRPLPNYNVTQPCSEAKRMERLATAQGVGRLSPEEWYRWSWRVASLCTVAFSWLGSAALVSELNQPARTGMPVRELNPSGSPNVTGAPGRVGRCEGLNRRISRHSGVSVTSGVVRVIAFRLFWPG